MLIKRKIEKILEKTIVPALEKHNGGVELIDVDEETGVVKVKFQGMCVGCPMADMTLKAGIEAELMEKIPEIREVIAVE